MDVTDAILKRRSIRNFKPNPVEKEKIEKVAWNQAQANPASSKHSDKLLNKDDRSQATNQTWVLCCGNPLSQSRHINYR